MDEDVSVTCRKKNLLFCPKISHRWFDGRMRKKVEGHPLTKICGLSISNWFTEGQLFHKHTHIKVQANTNSINYIETYQDWIE